MSTAELARLGAYDFGFLRDRFVYDNPQFADRFDEAVTELRKFYELVLAGHGPLANMSKLVDGLWHTHVLHTSQYRSFCQDVFGYYVDHRPHSAATPVPLEAISNFFREYADRFGGVARAWLENIPIHLVAPVTRGEVPAELATMKWSGWPGRK